MEVNFESKEYVRSRNAHRAYAAFDYFISIAVSDAFLARLLAEIGASDMLTGVISSFVALAFLFQLASLFIGSGVKNTKKLVVICNAVSTWLFLFLFVIPCLPAGTGFKIVLFIICILLAYFCKYFVEPALSKWAYTYVDPGKRGRYSAITEIISLFGGMIFTVIAGFVMDYFEVSKRIKTGFLTMAVLIMLLGICNFISLMAIAPDRQTEERIADQLKVFFPRAMGYLFHNKGFCRVVLIDVLWKTALYTTLGYLGTYKIKELGLSIGAVQIINLAANLCRMGVSQPFGKYSDKTSYAQAIELALFFAAAAFVACMFTTPETWWLIIAYTVLYSISMAGINQNSFNILYSYVDINYFVPAQAIKNSISGICGFAASVVGGKILGAIQKRGNTFGGIQVYGQQILAAISLMLILVLIIITHKVVKQAKIDME